MNHSSTQFSGSSKRRSYPLALVLENPRIRYVRKSTEEEDRQAASHQQQGDAMDREWGPLADPTLVYADSQSGKDFERPGFLALMDYCRKHRPAGQGIIEVYDHDRWGRPVKRKDGKWEANPAAFWYPIYELESLGWEVRFLSDSKTGDATTDFVVGGLKSIAASQFIEKLSRDLKRGKRDWTRRGVLTGGRAPWPTVRVNPKSGGILRTGERVFQSGVLLTPDPEHPENVGYWIEAAKMIVAGAPIVQVAEHLNTLGVPSPGGKLWNGVILKRVLTCRALVAELPVHSDDGSVEWVNAQWEPIVPVALFHEVGRELEMRENKDRRRRRKDNAFVLEPHCERCGAAYYGTEQRDRRGGRLKLRRRYVHSSPLAPISAEVKKRMAEHGCRQWTIDADELEEQVKNLILQERLSDNYAERLRELIEERNELGRSAQERARAAQDRVRKIQDDMQNLLDIELESRRSGLRGPNFAQKQQGLEEELERAQREYDAAVRAERDAARTWQEISALLKETDNLQDAWESGDVNRRREIVNWWVDNVFISVQESREGGKTRQVKQAHVLLAQAPGLEKILEMEPAQRPTTFKPRSAEATNKDGIVYDAKRLLADVERMVAEARQGAPAPR